MNVDAVDLGDELRQGIQPRLHLSPVVVGLPIAYELLDRPELDALGLIGNDLFVRPPGRRKAPAQIDKLLLGDVDAERPDCVARTSCRWMNREQTRYARRSHSHGGRAQELPSVRIDKVDA